MDDEPAYIRLETDVQSAVIPFNEGSNGVSQKISQNNKPTLKLYHGLIILAFIEICIALFVFLLGISCASLQRSGLDSRASCPFGIGIWVGLLCMIAAVNGFMALRVPHGKRGFMVAYMVCCIIVSVADGVLVALSGVWIYYHKLDFLYRGDSQSLARMCLNAFLLVCGSIHCKNKSRLLFVTVFVILDDFLMFLVVLSIISSAFLCYNFNCCIIKQSDVVTVYSVGRTAGIEPNTETVRYQSILYFFLFASFFYRLDQIFASSRCFGQIK